MKTLIVSLLASCLLFSCDPNEDKRIGRSNIPSGSTGDTGGGVGSGGGTGSGSGTGTGSGAGTTDAPLDGGLGLLLVAGAVYGAKRVSDAKKKRKSIV